VTPTRDRMAEFARFVAAGGAGFVVDLIVLLVLARLFEIGPLLARAASFTAALTTTWLINRNWTFRQPAKGVDDMRRELAGYGAVALIAGSANYLVYALLVIAEISTGPYSLVVAVVAGVAAGALINYFGMRRFVFHRGRRPINKRYWVD
jgi:putative flippase GtrA